MNRRASGSVFGGVSDDLWTDLLLLAAVFAALLIPAAGAVRMVGTGWAVALGTPSRPSVPDVGRRLIEGGDLHALWPGVPVPALFLTLLA